MFSQRSTLLQFTWVLILTFCLTACNSKAPSLHTLKIRSPQDLQQYFKYTGNDIPLISGHRGGTSPGYPENCIATFENVLHHTPAFFEVDPRLTKDSVIVLMHDVTLDRTTTGTGKVSDYTWEELKKLKLKDLAGNITTYGIPTLDEAIIWSRGKTILNLDKKDVPMEMIVEKLMEKNATGHIMVTVHNAQQAKFYYDNNKNIMFSAFVKTKKAMEEYEKAGIPWSHMIAYIGSVNQPENKEMYDLLHARGVMCMISAAPVYDKIEDSLARNTAYQEIIKAGANILESDRPIEVANAIQFFVPVKSPKQEYFTEIQK